MTPPPWLTALQAACSERGMRAVGRQMGCSAATLSLVLRGVYMAGTDRIEARVREHLQADLAAAQTAPPATPDWLQVLRAACAAGSQARTAEQLGISEATVSQALSGTYKAATTRIERRVRGELLGATCECPVMGDVSTRVCQDVQERRPPIANPQHAQAWFACRGRGPFTRAGVCPHFNGAGAPAAAQPAHPTTAPEAP